MRRRDARRAELERKLDEDLVILHRDLVQTIAVSPIASPENEEALTSAVEAMLARPNARRALKAMRRTPLPLGPYLDAQRGTENFDPLFRREIGFIFFQAARSLVDRRGVTTPAEIEAWRKTLVDDVERCENLAAAALSIGDLDEARLLQNDAAIGRALLANQPTLDDPRVVRRPGGGDPRRMKRRHRLDERDKSREPATLEAYRVALGVLADVHYALHALLRRPAPAVAAYIASAATGLPLTRLDIQQLTTAAAKRAREAAAC